jgi:hypothetical protein
VIGDASVFDGVAHPFNFDKDNAYGEATITRVCVFAW